jgi:hypothetical protein
MTLVDVLPMGNPELSPMWKRSGFSFTPAVFLSYPPANYINPDERGPLLYYFNSMFFTIMLVCVALRLYTRLCIRKYFGLDDVFIVCALVCFLNFGSTQTCTDYDRLALLVSQPALCWAFTLTTGTVTCGIFRSTRLNVRIDLIVKIWFLANARYSIC